MPRTFLVVDLFAGPGGLAEGFSSYRDGDHQPFNIVLSVEKEASAHRTLQLRSFLRQFDGEFPPEYYEFLNTGQAEPDWSMLYPEEWANACEEALSAELGTVAGNAAVVKRLAPVQALGAPMVVIGGPPCQAYSLVGRSRNQGNADYVAEDDKRHFLYQEYIGILHRLLPDAFVMENVKGMLSTSVEGSRIFGRVLADLRGAGGEPDSYRLFAIGSDPAGRMILQRADTQGDYVLLAERFGIPQARHRVIIVGIRKHLADKVQRPSPRNDAAPAPAILRHVLEGVPLIRSCLSQRDGEVAWKDVVLEQMARVCEALEGPDEISGAGRIRAAAERHMETFRGQHGAPPDESRKVSGLAPDCPSALRDWLTDPMMRATANHAGRRHMDDDLARYFYCAVFSEVHGRSPKSFEFPRRLAPSHANWSSGAFADRFRAQPWDLPATTVTSHISKDGHYFVHPDPLQCRSLTVREAARLQTFPDNYLFLGNRTQQYVQVGNAVPPFLAHQIAAALWSVLSAPDIGQSGHALRQAAIPVPV
jgi:DNA (cytosine-5)-methyltransferase 1